MSTTPFDPRQLRNAFGAFMTGVTVVTTYDDAGRPLGFTANSFASVSLDPPLLLVCIAKTSRNYQAFAAARAFAVNILGETQKDVSNTFARPVEDRFAAVEWLPGPHGSPVFPEAAAWFDCSQHQLIEAGDHTILIGRVEGFADSTRNGLGYARGGYFTAALEARAAGTLAHGRIEAAAVAERDGEILLVSTATGRYRLPGTSVVDQVPADALAAAIREQSGLTATIGFPFSVFADRLTGRQHVIYRATLDEGQPTAGQFFAIDRLPLDRLDTPQTLDVVTRYASEWALGNFGVYVGNELTGRVHPLPRDA